MTLLVDAGPLAAMGDRNSALGTTCRRIIEDERGEVVVPAYAAAEADYLVASRLGPRAERLLLEDLASGAYRVEAMTPDEHRLALQVDDEYPGVGLADLSLVVLAARHKTHRILTFDERDFRRLLPLDGGVFTVLPADELV